MADVAANVFPVFLLCVVPFFWLVVVRLAPTKRRHKPTHQDFAALVPVYWGFKFSDVFLLHAIVPTACSEVASPARHTKKLPVEVAIILRLFLRYFQCALPTGTVSICITIITIQINTHLFESKHMYMFEIHWYDIKINCQSY